MAQLPRYGVGRVDVATPETPTPSGRNPQAELLMAGGQALMGVARQLKDVTDKRKDLASDALADEKFRLLQESVYGWEAEKEKTADPDLHVQQHGEFFQKNVNSLLEDTKDPLVVQKFLKRASGFRTERLKHSYGIQNRAFVDREKANVIAETEKLGKFEYLMDDATFQKHWGELTEKMDRSLAVGGMTRDERVVAEQKAKDAIWGTRAYRQAVQAQPKNNDPYGTAVMWEATKRMETGMDDRYSGLSPERRIAVTSLLREEYSRRLTQANTADANARRDFNEERDAMEGVLLAGVSSASRGEEFELDGKMGKHTIEDVQRVAGKYSRVLGGKVNAIEDNARAAIARRDRVDRSSATPEEHNAKVRWLNKAYLKEVDARAIINTPELREDMKDDVLRVFYQKEAKTPEEKERDDEVKSVTKYIRYQLNTQTSVFVRDPQIAGTADRAAMEFRSTVTKNRDADIAEVASSILKRHSEHLKGALDPGKLQSQLPPRYQDLDEAKVIQDLNEHSLQRQQADFLLIQMRFIKGLREPKPTPAGPEKPAEAESPGVMGRIRGLLGGGGEDKARVRPPKE